VTLLPYLMPLAVVAYTRYRYSAQRSAELEDGCRVLVGRDGDRQALHPCTTGASSLA
jgi:hypothetical protein